jgi:fructose-bisphosphate aldolase class I|tara:strand:+ start:33 stop:308 length:276 start_codon:yes stop_codon:yes gene_type:complete
VQAKPVKVGRKHFKEELIATAKAISASGKGILAADEAPETMVSKFNGIGVDPSTENIRAYRELLFTAPDIEQYISGIIMFESTLNQTTADG